MFKKKRIFEKMSYNIINIFYREACAEFMPKICGEYLKKENWNAPNYRVICGE